MTIFKGRKLEMAIRQMLAVNPDRPRLLAEKIWEMAMAGEKECIKMLLDRESGKVSVNVEHSFQNSYLEIDVTPPGGLQLADLILAQTPTDTIDRKVLSDDEE